MKRWTVGFVMLVALARVKESHAEWSFTGLGSQALYAHDISADGRVVVGGQGYGWAWRWEAGNTTQLWFGEARAVSADGSVVVGTSGSDSFYWKNGKIYALGIVGSLAYGVSADGSVTVGKKTGYGGYRWENGLVDILDGTEEALDVSADGSVVVGRTLSDAFRWENGNIALLGTLGGPTAAYGVSADGSVVVGYSGNQAFRWANGEMVGLGGIWAWDASADGSVIVGIGSPGGAFIYESGRSRLLRDMLVDHGLDLTGWDLTAATGISDDGRTICGYGFNPTGRTEGWVATIPEPSTLALLSIGALALLAYAWRRRRAA